MRRVPAAKFLFLIVLMLVGCGPDEDRVVYQPSNATCKNLGRNSSKLQKPANARPFLVAHRGMSSKFPENTISSFVGALENGADMVEFDVHETKDHELIVLHDDTFDRTTNSEQMFQSANMTPSSLTISEIKKLDAGSWKGKNFSSETIPLMDEALHSIVDRGGIALIDYKGGAPEQYSRIVDQFDQKNKLVLQSSNWDFLESFKKLQPNIKVFALGDGNLSESNAMRFRNMGASGISWKFKDLEGSTMDIARNCDLDVFGYTVKTSGDLSKLYGWSLDGIISDIIQ